MDDLDNVAELCMRAIKYILHSEETEDAGDYCLGAIKLAKEIRAMALKREDDAGF